MSTEEDIEDAVAELNEAIADVADDTSRWTQEQSADIYEEVAAACTSRAQLIRSEMEL